MDAPSGGDAIDLEKLSHHPNDLPDVDYDNNADIDTRRDASTVPASDEKRLDGGTPPGNSVGGDDDADDDGDDEEEPGGVLGQILSRVTSRSSVDPGPPPDGGWLAWWQCLAGHIVIMNSWGWINSFGVFQPYYTTLLRRSESDVSWIGSLTVFLLFLIGTFTGRLTDAGLFRPVFLAGSLLQVGGLFATASCERYWQFLLAQGIAVGLGNGCVFCPTLALIATYFQRRRALAIGIVACGSATGGVVFPLMVRQLLPRIGFAWTIRSIAFIQLATLAFANLSLRPRIKPRKTGPLVDWAAFKEFEYVFYAAGSYFNFWGLYFTFYYLISFARDVLEPPMSFGHSLNLLLVLNGVGTVGRLVPNYLADRVGAVNVFIPTSLAASVLMYSWIGVSSSAGLYAWAALYGVVAGGIQSLFPAALSFLTTDLRRLGVRMGMVFTIVSFAVLTGPPIAGALVGGRAGYVGAQVFAATSLLAGCVCMLSAKLVVMRKKGIGWKDRV